MGIITLLVIAAPKVYFSMHARASRTILQAAISVLARLMIVSQMTRSKPFLLVGGVDFLVLLVVIGGAASASSVSVALAVGVIFCFLGFLRLVFADLAFVLSPIFLDLVFFLVGWVVGVVCSSAREVAGL